MTKKLSIIIPVYNVEKYLNICLDSVVLQLDAEIEVIVVDDGSTDNSKDILENYKNIPNFTIITKSNTGLADTRNTAVKSSSGEYVLFLDSDDYLESDSLSKILLALNSHKDIYVGKLIYAYGDEKKYEKIKNIDKVVSKDAFISIIGARTPAQRYIVKKQFLEENEISFPVGRLHEDVYWCNMLVDNMTDDNYEILTEEWYNYKQNVAGSIMQNQGFKNIKDVFEMGNILYDKLKNKTLKKKLSSTLYGKLFLYKNLTLEQKQFVENFIDDNTHLFKSNSLKYSIFYTFVKIFGSRIALKFASKFI